MAQEADMSLADYREFVFEAGCLTKMIRWRIGKSRAGAAKNGRLA